MIETSVNLLRNTEIPIFQFTFENLLFLHTLDQREVQRGLWPLFTNILGSPPANTPGEGKKGTQHLQVITAETQEIPC